MGRMEKDDDFGMRCRARTKAGRRCKNTSKWLIPVVVSRDSWLKALETGWPRIVRGMQPPEYRQIGFCRYHGNHYNDSESRYIYGIGKTGKPTLDAEYEAACAKGDNAVRAAGFSV